MIFHGNEDNKMKAEIVCIIDKSGSMGAIRQDAIGSFNRFLEDQKKVPGECKFTGILFDNVYKVHYDGKDLADVKPLDQSSYMPDGSTALYEFTHAQIAALIKEKQEKEKWEFIFLAANQDAFAVGAGINIATINTAGFAPTAEGVADSMNYASNSARAYRTGQIPQAAGPIPLGGQHASPGPIQQWGTATDNKPVTPSEWGQ